MGPALERLGHTWPPPLSFFHTSASFSLPWLLGSFFLGFPSLLCPGGPHRHLLAPGPWIVASIVMFLLTVEVVLGPYLEHWSHSVGFPGSQL